MTASIKSLVVIFVIVLSQFNFAQTTTIESIKKNPEKFEGNEVQITGLVTQYVEGKGATSYYLIKGDFGGILKVNTSEPAPETNVKYRVKGIVYIDQKNNTPFISEKSKTSLVVLPPPPPPDTVIVSDSASDLLSSNNILYGLIGLLIILIFVFVYFQFIRKPSITESSVEYESPQQSSKSFQRQSYNEPEPVFTSESEYKTIKIVKSSPKTLKFIPGKLIITDGADKGKEFRVAGYPSNEGFIISIGRKEVKGERAYAHIELKELTVSREQAELIQKDGKLFIKNSSETNYTQLNGVELRPGQMSEVTPGSTIRTGEVEFQYKV